jgi:hypothetical protein
MKSAIPAQWEEFLQALPGIDVGNEQQECILLLFSGGPPTEAGVPANRCHAISIDDARNMVMQFLHSLNQMGDPVAKEIMVDYFNLNEEGDFTHPDDLEEEGENERFV